MLSADVQFTDFTTRDWQRLGELFRSPELNPEPAPAPRPARGGLLGVRHAGRIIKLSSTVHGRLPPPGAGEDGSAEALARKHDADFSIIANRAGLEQLSDRFADRVVRGQHFHAQLEALLDALRSLEAESLLEVWPKPLRDFPMPTERALVAALDLISPDGKSVVLGAFHQGELYTAIALRRRGPGVDFVLGPDQLRRDMGLLSGDFRRDYRYLAAAVTERLGPIAVGCYAELTTFQALAESAEPGAWASAVASREVMLTPVTRGVALPLGIDAGRAALALARSVSQRFSALAGLSGFSGAIAFAPAFERAYSLVEGDVRRYLGFDPWRVLGVWFRGGA